MPVVRMQPRNSELVLIREKRDSAGRNDQQIWAMEQNAIKPPRLRGEDELYADQIRELWVNYPKVFYKLAVKWPKNAEGKPDKTKDPVFHGDRINPNYPMPYALAMENGYQGQVTGQAADKGVNVVLPYQTCYVPKGWNPELAIDIDEEDCKKQEAKLLKEGWVDHPSKLDLPEKIAAEVEA